jgi:hypothetical protein
VRATPATAPPLGAGVDEKRFKAILLDVGLLSASLGLSLAGLDPKADLMLAHRGEVAEPNHLTVSCRVRTIRSRDRRR